MRDFRLETLLSLPAHAHAFEPRAVDFFCVLCDSSNTASGVKRVVAAGYAHKDDHMTSASPCEVAF